MGYGDIIIEQQTHNSDPVIIQYLGPANVSISKLNLENYAVKLTSSTAGCKLISGPSWIPNDGNTQLFHLENNTHSLKNNPYGALHNALIILQDQNFYRITNIKISKSLFVNINYSLNPFCFMVGNFNSKAYVINSEFRDSILSTAILVFTAFKSTLVQNCIFNNFTNIQASMFGSLYCLSVIYDSLTFSNMSFDQFNNNELP